MPGLPWGISSMPPIETPSATQPIPYSNDGSHCSLIGCDGAEVSSPRSKIEQRGHGIGFGGGGGGDAGSGHN